MYILPNDGAQDSPFGYRGQNQMGTKSAMTVVLQYEDAPGTCNGEST